MKKKICLALGGGASKGLAHIGVIKALSENGFEITQIAGTSVGALVGGVYAANPDYRELEKIINQMGYLELVKVLVDWPTTSGLLRGKKMEIFLDKLCGQKKIENLPIKFKAVCADLVEGKQFVFETGLLATAIRASCAIPAIFSPVKFGEKLLIDGGAVNPIPVSEIKAESDERIVAVGLYSNVFPKNFTKLAKANFTQIAYASMQVMTYQLAIKNIYLADLSILPPVKDINALDFVKAKKYVEIGYQSTMEKISEIEKLF